MNNNLIRLAIVVLVSFIPLNAYAIEWYDTDWTYRIPITINATEVQGNNINFPILVNHTNIHIGTNAEADGSDILFTDEDSLIKFDHEIELFDEVTGHVIAWVEIPNVTDAADQNIFMYYKDTGGNGAQNNTAGTWNSNYVLVYHGNDYLDSTSFNNDALNEGTTIGLVDQNGFKCPIGNCYNFDGINDRMNSGNDTSFNFDMDDPFTVQFWWNGERDENLDNQGRLANKRTGPDQGWFIRYAESFNQSVFIFEDDLGNADSQDNGLYPSPMPRETLVLSHFTWDGLILGAERGMDIFDNGTETSTNDNGGMGNNMTNQDNLFWGDSWDGNIQHEGRMDEMRIMNVQLTPDWIQTEWNNQNIYGPNNFLIYSAFEEQLGLEVLRDTIYLRVATPLPDRMGGIKSGICIGRVIGVDTNGTLICGQIFVIAPQNETQDLNNVTLGDQLNMTGPIIVSSTQFTLNPGGESVTCNFDGFVQVSANLYLQSSVLRPSVVVRPQIDGDYIGGWGASGYIRDTTGHNHASIHGQAVGLCNEGELISFLTQNEAGGGFVRLDNVEDFASNVIFERIS